MKKIKRFKPTRSAAFLLSLCVSIPLFADHTAVFTRIYEGYRKTVNAPPRVVSAYYLKRDDSHSQQPGQVITQEKESLTRIFSLKDIKLITQGKLIFADLGNQRRSLTLINHPLRFALSLSLESSEKNLFQVKIEEGPQNSPTSLLNSKVIIPPTKTAVLGFEDSKNRIYFLSFSRSRSETLPASTIVTHSRTQGPRLIERKEPTYPRQAVEEGLQGMIILEGRVNREGRMGRINILQGEPPILADEAVKAIKTWRYQPLWIKGEIYPFTVAVTVNFLLEKSQSAGNSGVVHFTIDTKRLRFLKKVDPVYPRQALKEAVQGEVKIGVLIDKQGQVIQTKVVDGHPLLAASAVDAISQWRFEPYLKGGKRSFVLIVITLTYSL